MTPTVWGPIMWQVLFYCAWNACDEDMSLLHKLVFELVPRLLPCHTCRANFYKHKDKIRRRRVPDPTTPAKTFHWLYLLKHEVNKDLGVRQSLPFKDLQARYQMHDGCMPHVVHVMDLLVMVAFVAHSMQRDDECVEFFQCLAHFFRDTAVCTRLAQAKRPVVNHALSMANEARTQHDLPARTMRHYQVYGDA